MGRLLRRIQKTRIKKRKVSFMLPEQLLKKMDELQEQIECQSRSDFVEKLLEFALEKLEGELRKVEKVSKEEEKLEEERENLIAPRTEAKFKVDLSSID